MRFFVVLLAICMGCADDADAGSDAGTVFAPDARGFVVSILDEYNRYADLTCPCLVQEQGFASLDECYATIGYNDGHVECIGGAVVRHETESLREQLRCELNRAHERNLCLAAMGCGDSGLVCYENAPLCPVMDIEVLTAVLTDCPDAAVLGR